MRTYSPTMQGVLELVKDLRSLVKLATTIPNFLIPENIEEGIAEFEEGARELATQNKDGRRKEVEAKRFYHTNGAGVRLKNALQARLEAFLGGAPKFFNDLVSEIGSKAPGLFAEYRNQINSLIEQYHAALVPDERDLEKLVKLNVEISGLLIELRRKANEHARREEARRKRGKAAAMELLEILG